MGKKPVVAIVGLIWAGMALVGCENCKNCRQKFTPAPTFPANAGGPGVGSQATPSVVTPTASAGGAAGKAEMAKTADAVGTKGFGSESPAVGMPVSTGSTTGSPTIQDTLRPNNETRPMGLPGQNSGYLSGETPLSMAGPAERGLRMPPPPVTQVGGSTEALPPITPASALPQPPLQPSIPSMPMPPSTGNKLPGIDPPSR
jgi:hypothetical protein